MELAQIVPAAKGGVREPAVTDPVVPETAPVAAGRFGYASAEPV